MDNQNSNAKTQELEERVAELENNWKRALADYKNLEKRTAEEKAELMTLANLVLVAQLLPILDNLELLQKHIEDTGLNMIVKELKQTLENNGLEEINAKGEDFDPLTMDASELVEGEPGKVMEIIQKGYMFKNKLIRPAKVNVGKNKEE
jgi:molecular chaperone GrpE